MKKLLLIHNLYRETGGEDVAVKREVEILKKYFQVETVYFSNKVDNIFARIPLFFTSKNKKSEKQISKIIEEFNPDIAYVHNTWFEASLSIFDILKRCNVKTVLKLHNFRYYCSSTFFHKKHIRNNQYCHACGQKKNKLRIFNKYFSNSYLKSFMVNLYGIKYFKILKDYDLKIVVLTKFHQRFLIELGVAKEKINVFPNLMQTNNSVNNYPLESDYLVYAGRISEEKGVEELIQAFLNCNFIDKHLKIIGTGPLLSKLKKNYDEPSILFLNNVKNSEVLKIISKSKAVVTATKLFEGQPTLLCEASTLGIPSIFPRSGGIEEFFPKGYPLSFKQFNYSELTEKLIMVENAEFLNSIGNENEIFFNNNFNEIDFINNLKRISNG
ncbi:MAG: hypothetical protein CMC31_03400 [Flavobacteriaceae bacterium]|nr:hypothetical protein [Flavobacteriaceae bacterium]